MATEESMVAEAAAVVAKGAVGGWAVEREVGIAEATMAVTVAQTETAGVSVATAETAARAAKERVAEDWAERAEAAEAARSWPRGAATPPRQPTHSQQIQRHPQSTPKQPRCVSTRARGANACVFRGDR